MNRPARLVVALAALSGCSSEHGLSPLPPGVEALYGPTDATFLSPYPSDRYTRPDGATRTGLRVDIAASGAIDLVTDVGVEETLAELDASDGFSTTGGVIVSFSGPVDVQGLVLDTDGALTEGALDASDFTAAGSPFVLLDVDPASPAYGTAHGLVVRAWQEPEEDRPDEHTVIAQPARPLAPGTRYLFAVTGALAAADGGAVRRSPAMDALLEGGDASTYGEQVREGVAILQDRLGIEGQGLVLATSFTTRTVHEQMLSMAAQVRALPAPALLEPWSVERPVQEDGRVRLSAVYGAPEWRGAGERVEVDDDGGVVMQTPSAPLEVFAAISDAHTSVPRTVVIYGHGLAGDKDGCWGTAQRLAGLNAAVFAIDSPHHGSRSDDPDSPFATVLRFFGIDAGSQAFVIGKARDNFRQMASDQLQLVRLIGSLGSLDVLPPGAPDGVPDLDTSRILYIGHSFGSVQGATVFALAPEIDQAVWNVGGAGLTTLLRDSSTFALLINTFRVQRPEVGDAAVARFFAVIQGILDPGDPLNFARYGTLAPLPGVPGARPRHVLLQEVLDDTIVPNSTTRALARAAGLPLVDALEPFSGAVTVPGPVQGNLASGATGAMVQFGPGEGDDPIEHGTLIFSPEARAQYVEFFLSGAGADNPVIRSAGSAGRGERR